MPTRLQLVFALDAALLLIACALQSLQLTGLTLHEWIALAAVGLIVLHLLLSWTWIAATLRRLTAPGSWRSRFNYLLNVLLFATFAIEIYSGIILSESALPAFGIRMSPGDMSWRYIHNRFSNYFTFLVVLHFALNWDWSFAAFRKLVLRGSARGNA